MVFSKTFWFSLACVGAGLVSFLSLGANAVQSDDEKSTQIPSGIVWYGVLADGVAEAKATNRPIMFLAAAPQCAGVPGMW